MSGQESTLILIKPDAVKRGLCSEIVSRFERRGLTITALKLVRLSQEVAAKHYEEHKAKPFYPDLLTFIMSGPVVAMVVTGAQAISVVRKMIGSTNPVESPPELFVAIMLPCWRTTLYTVRTVLPVLKGRLLFTLR